MSQGTLMPRGMNSGVLWSAGLSTRHLQRNPQRAAKTHQPYWTLREIFPTKARLECIDGLTGKGVPWEEGGSLLAAHWLLFLEVGAEKTMAHAVEGKMNVCVPRSRCISSSKLAAAEHQANRRPEEPRVLGGRAAPWPGKPTLGTCRGSHRLHGVPGHQERSGRFLGFQGTLFMQHVVD